MPSAKQLKRRHVIKSLPKYILKTLAVTGAIIIAGQSPYFTLNIIRNIRKRGFSLKESRAEKQRISNTFKRLLNQGLIEISRQNHQIFISLTKEGKKKAGLYQLNDLEIPKPKSWDHVWRILIFDIPENTKISRDALRGKLIELGFKLLQKSVWVHAYPCANELKLLQDFFGFEDSHYILLKTKNLGGHDTKFKEHFDL